MNISEIPNGFVRYALLIMDSNLNNYKQDCNTHQNIIDLTFIIRAIR